MATAFEPELHVLAQKVSDHELRINSHSDRIAKMELGCARHEPLLDQIKVSLEKMSAAIEEIKAKPGKRWESVVGKVLDLAVGGVVGYIITQMIKG